MILLSVCITGFRSIGGPSEIPISSKTLLTGQNDAGKSGIIDAIRFLLGDLQLDEKDRTIESFDGDSPVRVEQTCVEGRFELSGKEREELGLAAEVSIRRRSPVGSSATLEVLSSQPVDLRLRDIEGQKVDLLKKNLKDFGVSGKGLKIELADRLRQVAKDAEQEVVWAPAQSPIAGSLPRPQRFDTRSSQDPEEVIRSVLQTSYRSHLNSDEMQGTVSEITSVLETRVSDDAASLCEFVADRCPGVGVVKIRPTVRFDLGLRATEISVSNDRGEEVTLGRSGAGTARRVALAVWEFNSQLLKESQVDTILLYDEPDTHLDYLHQREFTGLLESQCSLPNVQAVVATHSMNLIDGVDIAAVLHVKNVDGRTTAQTLTDDSKVGQHLGAIAASLGLRNTVLLHERLFVGVEGPTEARGLPILFRLMTGRQMESSGIALWQCGNNDGALRFAEFLKKNEREVLMLLDEDSRGLKIFRDDKLIGCGLDPENDLVTLGDPKEIEECFSDEAWALCANEAWPRQDERLWVDDDFKACRESGKFSSGVESMLRTDCQEGTSPGGKPEIFSRLCMSLRDSSQIPEQISAAFKLLIERAR